MTPPTSSVTNIAQFVINKYDPIVNETVGVRFGWIYLLRERFEADAFLGAESTRESSPVEGQGPRHEKKSNTVGTIVTTTDIDFIFTSAGESVTKLRGPLVGFSFLYRMQLLPLDIRVSLGAHQKRGTIVTQRDEKLLDPLNVRDNIFKTESSLFANGTSAALDGTYRLPRGFSVVLGLFHERHNIKAKSLLAGFIDGSIFKDPVSGAWKVNPNDQQNQNDNPLALPLLLKYAGPSARDHFTGSQTSWGMHIGIEKRFDL